MQKWNSYVQASPNALIIEFSNQILKLNPILQNFNPIPLSPYLDSEQQIIDFLWKGVDGKMLNVHNDSAIFIRETCWGTNSTIYLNLNTSQKKEKKISIKILFTACEYITISKIDVY